MTNLNSIMDSEQLEKNKILKSEFELSLFKLILESDLCTISKKLNLNISYIKSILNENVGLDNFVVNHIEIFKLEFLFRFYSIFILENSKISAEFIIEFDKYLKLIDLNLDYTKFIELFEANQADNKSCSKLKLSTVENINVFEIIEDKKGLLVYKNKKETLLLFSFPEYYETENFYLTINKYIGKIDWDKLTINKTIKWDISLIKKYEELINWELLSGRPDLEWTEDLLFEFRDKFIWGKFSIFEGGISYYDDNKDFMSSLTNPLDTNFNETTKYFKFDHLNCISYNNGIVWSVSMIQKFENYIDFFLLARNAQLDYEIIKHFENKWTQSEVVCHKSIKRNSDTWDKFNFYSTCWENLSINNNIVLNHELYEYLSNVNIKIEKYYNGTSRESYTELITIKANTLFYNCNLEENFIIDVINEPLLYHNIFYNWESSNRSLKDYVYDKTILKNGSKIYGIEFPQNSFIKLMGIQAYSFWLV